VRRVCVWTYEVLMRHLACERGSGAVASVFFFQAEDGIRDWSVTGVQTCALPISDAAEDQQRDRGQDEGRNRPPRHRAVRDGRSRSEERRVGKEGRTRRLRYGYQKGGSQDGGAEGDGPGGGVEGGGREGAQEVV